MELYDPNKLREAMSALPPLTNELLCLILAFKEQNGLSGAELVAHIRALEDLFRNVTSEAKSSRFDPGSES